MQTNILNQYAFYNCHSVGEKIRINFKNSFKKGQKMK